MLFVSVAFELVACATLPYLPDSPETRNHFLADARVRSASYCAKTNSKCEFAVKRLDDGRWLVRVVPVYVGANGTPIVGIGTDVFYYYNRRGKLVDSDAGY
jgi:hypothetical protein